MKKSFLGKVVVIIAFSVIVVEILRYFRPDIMTTQIVGPLIVSISTLGATYLFSGMAKK